MLKEELIAGLRRLSAEERSEILAEFSRDTAGGKAPRVFLSYSRDDTFFVRDLMAGLERGGVRVWLDVRELLVGEDYRVATEKGLRECDYCLVVVSPYAMKSAEVGRELDVARAVGTKILPVLLQDAVLVEPLRYLQWIDFRAQFETPLIGLIAHLHGRRDASLIEQRFSSALKPLAKPGEFIPLLHRNLPASVRWFCGLLMVGALGILSAAIPYLGDYGAVGLFVLIFFGALTSLIMMFAFRVAQRRETLAGLRSAMWVVAGNVLLLGIAFSAILVPQHRWLPRWILVSSAIVLVAAVLVAELSREFRRWLPARPEKMEIWPAWLRFRKRSAPPASA